MGTRAGLAVLLAYVLLSVAYTWPVATGLTTHLPHDLGDPVLNTWLMWWNAHHVPFTTEWWDGAGFYPVDGTIAFSEHLVGLAWLSSPLQWIGASAVTAYNVSFVLSFALSGFAAHLLAFALTGTHAAAALAGVAFGLAPYRAAQMSHIQVLATYWMPLALLGLHRYANVSLPVVAGSSGPPTRDSDPLPPDSARAARAGDQARWLAIFGACWLMQSLSNLYYLLFFSVFVALWIGWFLVRPGQYRRALIVLSVWALAAMPLIPVVMKYRAVQEHFGMQRSLPEIQQFSADVTGLLLSSPLLLVWQPIAIFDRHEGQLFGALILIVPVAWVAIRAWRNEPAGPERSAWRRRILLIVAVVFALVALFAAVRGSSRMDIGPVHISLSTPYKPLTVAFWSVVLLGATGRRAVEIWRRRSVFAFYVLAAVAMWVLALGPAPTIFGRQFLYRAPYWFLLQLPGFQSVRVPARFAMLAVLGLSIAAALALARLKPIAGPRFLRIAAIVIGSVTLTSWLRGVPLHAAPELPPFPDRGVGAIIELPMKETEQNIAALFRSMAHRKHVVNGYSGYEPPHHRVMRAATDEVDLSVLGVVAPSAGLLAAIDTRQPQARSLSRAAGDLADAEQAGNSSAWRFYVVPRNVQGKVGAVGAPLRIARLTFNGTPLERGRFTDPRSLALWTSAAPQRGDEVLTLELDAPHAVSGVEIALGPYVEGYPRRLVIEMSEHGVEWPEVWSGGTAAQAVEGALESPIDVPLRISFPAATARFVRLRQRGSHHENTWSISRVRVFGTPRKIANE